MGEVNHITEIIPAFDKLPDWAREAFEDGQYHAVVSEKAIEAHMKSFSYAKGTRFVWIKDIQAIIKGNKRGDE